jgi:hypothetical protein
MRLTKNNIGDIVTQKELFLKYKVLKVTQRSVILDPELDGFDEPWVIPNSDLFIITTKRRKK